MRPARTHVDRAKARVGTILRDKWRIDGLIGVGGTAAVYAATHRNGKRGAIKMLHPELAANEELTLRFKREGYVANRIGHPGAVSVIDDDIHDDGNSFLVMELLEGRSVEREGKLQRMAPIRVLEIGDAVLDLLAVAHAKGIVHRDIKPSNLFLTKDGRTKVLDFGIARLNETVGDATSTQTGTAIGTPAFMPPEQARGRWNMVSGQTDLWALGATLYSLITHERPRRAETVQEELLLAMTTPIRSLGEVMPELPKDVVHLIDKALAFEMEDRWKDALSMQRALRAALVSLRLNAPAAARTSHVPAPEPSDRDALTGDSHPFTTNRPTSMTDGRSRPRDLSMTSTVAVAAALGVLITASVAFAAVQVRNARERAAAQVLETDLPRGKEVAALPPPQAAQTPRPVEPPAPAAPPTTAEPTTRGEALPPHAPAAKTSAKNEPPKVEKVKRPAPPPPKAIPPAPPKSNLMNQYD